MSVMEKNILIKFSADFWNFGKFGAKNSTKNPAETKFLISTHGTIL
jgi:hypothetical protein